MAKAINIFGTKFSYPKGLRKQRKSTPYNSCVAGELSGKHFSSKTAQKQAFRTAASKCSK